MGRVAAAAFRTRPFQISPFKIRLDQRDAHAALEVGDAAEVAVQPDHRVAEAVEQPQMPPAAAGEVEHRPARPYQRGESLHPGGGRRRRMRRRHGRILPGRGFFSEAAGTISQEVRMAEPPGV